MPEIRSMKIGTVIPRESDLTKLQSKDCKHFRSMHVGQSLICPSGAEVQFIDGTFSSCDQEAIDACTNAANSRVGGIFVLEDERVAEIIASAKKAEAEIKAAAEAATKAAGEATK